VYKIESKGPFNINPRPNYNSAMDTSEFYIAKIWQQQNKPLEKIVIEDNEFSELEELFKDTEIEFEDVEIENEECELDLDEIQDIEIINRLDGYYQKPLIP